MNNDDQNGQSSPESFEVRVLRQDGPDRPSYWQRHRVPYQHDMNVISALQSIAAGGTAVDGKATAPVAWDCNCLEEVCGACTMVVNGRVQQACTALIDRLLADESGPIELQPMTKFPVVRDLMVDRSRMFQALERVKAWIPVDGYYDAGPGDRQSRDDQEVAYPLSQCMTCGCCVDACPQFTKIELSQSEQESAEDFEQRKIATNDQQFIGPHAISQVVLFNTNPTGKMNAGERLDALMEPGGLQICGNAQNCVAVCPKEIPLTTSIAKAGRSTTKRMFQRWFDK